MKTTSFGEFSEFTCDQLGIKVSGEKNHKVVAAVGSIEESMNTKTVVKKYKGIEAKTRTKSDGTGEVKISAHVAYDTYIKIYGMDVEGLIKGVTAYGQDSVHKPFSITSLVLDEDDNKKLKAYPNVIIKEGKSGKIENGGEEVQEIELTISVMPDEYGIGMYEALYDEMDAEMAKKWMSDFSPAWVHGEDSPQQSTSDESVPTV